MPRCAKRLPTKDRPEWECRQMPKALSLAHKNREDSPPGRTGLAGGSGHAVKAKLRQAGLRPTRQRIALGSLLFGKGFRHVTADMLHREAADAQMPVTLPTVYNTLRQFTDAGLLRQLTVDASKSYFDTNNSAHHHFFIEDEQHLMDIPASGLLVGEVPTPPEGYEIVSVEAVVRLRRKPG
jgi:Fur family transcriptional regulator, iron response regulator